LLTEEGLFFNKQPGYSRGYGVTADKFSGAPLYYAARCDNLFYRNGMRVGETYTGSDGSTLTFAADDVTVNTPAGSFTGCQRWVFKAAAGKWYTDIVTDYKEGVGIVQQNKDGVTCVLTDYAVNGGDGLIPFAQGNRWVYEDIEPDPYILGNDTFEVVDFDGKRAVLTGMYHFRRTGYAEDWESQMHNLHESYTEEISDSSREQLLDVSSILAKVETLAATPYQKVHTAVAAKTMKRIFETDTDWTPDCEWKGHWNFFQVKQIEQKDGMVIQKDTAVHYDFEWKNPPAFELTRNFLYDIINENAGCLWNDEWKPGYTAERTHTGGSRTEVSDKISVTVPDSTETPVGVFHNCLRVTVDSTGNTNGFGYRDGIQHIDYVPGIGIVKVEILLKNYDFTYALTEYTGTGEGYFPLADGMKRKYMLIDGPDHLLAGVEYTYVKDDDGGLRMLADQIGLQKR